MALVTGITSGGQSVRSNPTGGNRKPLILQNVGTVAISVFYNVDGAGDPTVWLAAGTVNDDGLGGTLTDEFYKGSVWAKAPAGGGRLLAS